MNIDHLLYTCPNLEKGIDDMENLLGTRAAIGGRHHKFGTHNAILSLGKSTYLEIVSPCPDLKIPVRGLWLSQKFQQPPGLSTWAIQSRAIKQAKENAEKHGSYEMGEIEDGSREKEDGTVLNWKLTDPYRLSMEGAIPFIIDWADTPHPAKNSPNAGELKSLIITHPSNEILKKWVANMGVKVTVEKGEYFKMRAQVATESGLVVIE